MSQICPKCGYEFPEESRFCPECGAPAPGALQPQTQPRDSGSAAPTARTVFVTQPAGPEEAVVGTGAFWGLKLLYSIPVVGFICSIVLSIAPRNRNIKHHALANLIWKLVAIALLIVSLLLLRPVIRQVSDQMKDAISEITGGEFSFDDLGEMQGMLQQYGIDDLGDLGELQGLLQEYGIQDIGDLQSYLEEHGGGLDTLPED